MKKILILYSLLLIPGLMPAQVRLERSYEKTFPLEEKDKFEVSNKYGKVNVRTWYSDSVKIQVEVVAEAKSQSLVNDEMDRVNVRLEKNGMLVRATTEFIQESGKGFFGGISEQAGGITKNNRITVNYEILIPENSTLSVENKYGDVFLPSLIGIVTIDLSHGNLRGDRIDGNISLTHSFGKHAFEYVENGVFKLKGAESRIAEGNILTYESSGSEVELGKIRQVSINSRNDKYHGQEIDSFDGDGTFTDLTLDYVLDRLKLDFDYGEIFVSRMDKLFDSFELYAKFCDIQLILDQSSYIKTRVAGFPDRMILPNSMLGMKQASLPDGMISLEGYVGNTNTEISALEVTADKGKLIISIQETDLFTNRD